MQGNITKGINGDCCLLQCRHFLIGGRKKDEESIPRLLTLQKSAEESVLPERPQDHQDPCITVTKSINRDCSALRCRHFLIGGNEKGCRHSCLTAPEPPQPQVKPTFLKEMEPLLTVLNGEPAQLKCKVSAHPPAEITWLKDDVPLKDEHPYEITCRDGEARLRISECEAGNKGTYICRAANSVGQDTSVCSLDVPGDSSCIKVEVVDEDAAIGAFGNSGRDSGVDGLYTVRVKTEPDDEHTKAAQQTGQMEQGLYTVRVKTEPDDEHIKAGQQTGLMQQDARVEGEPQVEKIPQVTDKASSCPAVVQNLELLPTSEGPLRCGYCEATFNERQHLRLHELSHTGGRKRCQKASLNEGDLKQHERSHTGVNPHQYRQCRKTFIRKGALKQHDLRHTQVRPHKCEQCTKAFFQKGTLKVHELTHTREKPHQCSQCERAFTRKWSLKQHELSHTRERPHQCSQCERAFTRKRSLKQHELFHTRERPHQCSQCERAFTRKWSLKQHELLHTRERPHQCSQCGKTFIRKADMTKHEPTHIVGSHQCSQCGNVFLTKRGLKQHEHRHTGVRPYQCGQCGKMFIRKDDMTRHEPTHIVGSPQCSQCGKAFLTKRGLKQHEHRYTGVRPYQCRQCGKKFFKRSSMKHHELKHTCTY